MQGLGAGVRFVEVSADGVEGRISTLFTNVGLIILVVPLVCWPLLLSVVWIIVSLGTQSWSLSPSRAIMDTEHCIIRPGTPSPQPQALNI